MNNDLKVRITGDPSHFQAAMSTVQQTARHSQERISKLGTAVSGLGTAFGGVRGPIGMMVTEVANIVGLFGALGVGGLVIGGALAGINLLTSKTRELKNEAVQVNEALEGALKDAESRWRQRSMGSSEAKIDTLTRDLRASKQHLDEINDKLAKMRKLYHDANTTSVQRGELKKQREAVVREQETLQREVEAKALILIAERDILRTAQQREDTEKRSADYREAAERRRSERTKLMALAIDNVEAGLRQQADAQEERDRRESERQTELARQKKEALEEQERINSNIAEQRDRAYQNEVAQHNELAELRRQQAQENARFVATMALDAHMTSIRILADWVSLQSNIAAARKAGNTDALYDLERQERAFGLSVLQNVLDNLGQRAMAEGSMMVLKGVGELALATLNPAGAIAAGLGLIALGGGAVVGAAAMSGAVASAQGAYNVGVNSGNSYSSNAPPSTSAAPTTAAAAGPTIINYYFGGPVFGNADDAARAVARFSDRGHRLDGRRAA